MRCFCNQLCKWTIVLCGCLFLSSCMLGPDFHAPSAPHVKKYTPEKLPKKTASAKGLRKAGASQRFVSQMNLPGEWWHLFHSPALDELIRLSLENSPNLEAAKAALWQARENYLAQLGTFFPTVGGQVNAEKQRFSASTIGGNTGSSVFNLFNVTANISYTVDVFGGLRRQAEAFGAQIDYQQYQLIAAFITLTANVVTTAITVASLKSQIATTKELLAAQQATLGILQKQFQLGGVSKVEVYTQQTLVDQTRATLPPLQKSLAQTRHALTTLVGVPPSCKLPELRLKELNLPKDLPVILPSQLVRRRPDVQASEALLHAASAQIGVATANLFPQITLTGNYGWTALNVHELFTPFSKTWMMSTNLLQPIFQGGSLLAQRRAALAAYSQVFAQYRQTVLQAFQNVADSLRAIETDARTLRYQRQAEIASRNALKLAQAQYRLGGASYLILLNAQQQYLQTRINRVQAEAARYNDTAALFQALGGGWWNYTNTCQNRQS